MNNDEEGVKEIDPNAPTDTEVKTNESGASADHEDTTDYKALYEKQRVRADSYKTGLITLKKQVKSQAPIEELDEEEDENKPVTLKDLKLFRQETTLLAASSKEDTLLAQKVPNPEKRKLVKLYLDTRIVRTGTSDQDILEDIDFVLSSIDGSKAQTKATELKRAIDNDPTKVLANNGSQSDRGVERKPHGWNATQEKELERKAQSLGIKDVEKFKVDSWQNTKKTAVAFGR